jgi:hypothetical protein
MTAPGQKGRAVYFGTVTGLGFNKPRKFGAKSEEVLILQRAFDILLLS